MQHGQDTLNESIILEDVRKKSFEVQKETVDYLKDDYGGPAEDSIESLLSDYAHTAPIPILQPLNI